MRIKNFNISTMSIINILLPITFLIATLPIQANQLYDIIDGKYRAHRPEMPLSMNDGEHFTVFRDGTTILKYSYKTGQLTDTLLHLPTVRNAPVSEISGYVLSPRETKILVYTKVKRRYRRSFTAEYYIYDIKYKEFDPLSSSTPQEDPVFSPDDRYIAFSHAHNLYMKKVDFKTDIQLTKDGAAGKIRNGISDWVYEEEFAATRYYEWSPDSKLLAFVKFDESSVNQFSFQRFIRKPGHLTPYPFAEIFNYPKAGEVNSTTNVYVYDDFNKTTRHMKVLDDNPDMYIPRIQWTKDPEKLIIYQMNRQQNRLDMLQANPRTGICKLILRREDKAYVDYQDIDGTYFTNDNKFFYTLNDKDGYRHIYQHKMDGTVARQVTKGNWEVTEFYGVDESRGMVYYQSAENSPVNRDVYVVDIKGKKTCLTDKTSYNTANFSKKFQYFILSTSSVTQPDQFTLRNNKGTLLRELEMNRQLAETVNSQQFSKKEFFSFTTSEGVSLNGWMMKPTQIDPEKKYPVLLVQYSGPGSQQVINQWNIGWEYYLTTRGYIVACVDGRGTGARGAGFLKSTYKQLGVLETKDQVEAANYLGQQSYIDKNRIGIWGWSFGGSMTLWAMSTGEPVFKAGISVAPVTDWRLYNTAYTERFMLTPEENTSGYDNTSAILKAEKLSGRLLLIHGTADDNVHIQNTYLYTNALVEAGKQFEMQIYTDKNHSITGQQTRRHLYTRKVEFLEKNL